MGNARWVGRKERKKSPAISANFCTSNHPPSNKKNLHLHTPAAHARGREWHQPARHIFSAEFIPLHPSPSLPPSLDQGRDHPPPTTKPSIHPTLEEERRSGGLMMARGGGIEMGNVGVGGGSFLQLLDFSFGSCAKPFIAKIGLFRASR